MFDSPFDFFSQSHRTATVLPIVPARTPIRFRWRRAEAGSATIGRLIQPDYRIWNGRNGATWPTRALPTRGES
jgi:hypothetical protein